MSHEGLFDAAISHLTTRLNSRGEGSEREELRQAIRWLEVAGKVDKGALLTLGANAVCKADYDCHGEALDELEIRFKEGEEDLKILIDSLPEPEKEKK